VSASQNDSSNGNGAKEMDVDHDSEEEISQAEVGAGALESTRYFTRSYESRTGTFASSMMPPNIEDRIEPQKVEPGNLHMLSSKYEVMSTVDLYLFYASWYINII